MSCFPKAVESARYSCATHCSRSWCCHPQRRGREHLWHLWHSVGGDGIENFLPVRPAAGAPFEHQFNHDECRPCSVLSLLQRSLAAEAELRTILTSNPVDPEPEQYIHDWSAAIQTLHPWDLPEGACTTHSATTLSCFSAVRVPDPHSRYAMAQAQARPTTRCVSRSDAMLATVPPPSPIY